MLIIVETKRNVHTFMSFDEVVTFLRENILTVEEKGSIAQKAITLLNTNNIAPDLIQYYRNIFESHLTKHFIQAQSYAKIHSISS